MPDSAARLNQDRGVSYLYIAAALVIVVAGMRAAEAIVNPLLLAVFLSVISAPAYFGLLKKNVPNWLALLTVIGVLSIVVLGVLFVVMESIAGFTSRQEDYIEKIHRETMVLRRKVEAMLPEWARDKPVAVPNDEAPADAEIDQKQTPDTAERLAEPTAKDASDAEEVAAETSSDVLAVEVSIEPSEGAANESADDVGEALNIEAPALIGQPSFGPPHRNLPRDEQGWKDFMSSQFDPGTVIIWAAGLAGSIGQLLSNAFLILLTVIFILLEAGTFTQKMKDAFVRTEETTERAQQIVKSIQHYIVIKTWVSLATGLFVVLWMKPFGVPYAALWGLLAFLFNFIPNVGSVIAAVPAILIAWLELGMLPASGVAFGFLIVNGVIGNFIEPRLMGKGLGLSPLIVFFSMVFWGWVLGPVGMLLSVPLTMTARIALDGFEDTRWVATLMGSAE